MAMPLLELPATQTAIITTNSLQLEISHEIPTPRLLEPDLIIVKNVAVALNPTDYKMPANFPSPGAISGCDFAGVVLKIGPAVTKPFKIGDRVFGVVHGSNPICHQSGAFAEYVAATADFVLKMPDEMDFRTAAVLGGAVFGTVGLALYYSLGLPPPNTPAEKAFYVVVYGASTACGTMAIQLLRLSGILPLAICSPKNFDLVKSYGAVEVFDYNSSSCASDVRAYTKNSLRYVLDTITNPTTTKLCYAAIGQAGGKYSALDLLPEVPDLRRTVRADWVMGITLSGKEIALGNGYEREPNLDHFKFGQKWFRTVQNLLDEGKLKPHPMRAAESGFEGILQGLDILRTQAISGQKLVCVLR